MALLRLPDPRVRMSSLKPARRTRPCALPRIRGRVGWGLTFRSQCPLGLPPSQPSPASGGRVKAQCAAVDDANRQASRCGERADAALPRVRGRIGWGPTFRSQCPVGSPPSQPSPVNGGRGQAQCAAVDDANRQASRCGERADAALPRVRGRVEWGPTIRSHYAVDSSPSQPSPASGGGRQAQSVSADSARRPAQHRANPGLQRR